MLSCWFESPIDRPVFSGVAASINALIEPLAGYLDFADFKDNSHTDIEKVNESFLLIILYIGIILLLIKQIKCE